MMPSRLSSPCVGFRPTMPFAVDGPRIDPPVSVPRPTARMPPRSPRRCRRTIPTACASGRADCAIWPPSELCAPPDANSDRFTLARMIAPASRSFFTTNASSGGIEPSSSTEPPVVGMSKVSIVVLEHDRDAVQRRARALGLALGVERARRLERLRIERDDGVQRRPLAVVGLRCAPGTAARAAPTSACRRRTPR